MQSKLRRAPPSIRGEPLRLLLEANEHAFVLDEVERTQLPYQTDYVDIHAIVFEDIEQRRLFSVLQVRPRTVRVRVCVGAEVALDLAPSEASCDCKAASPGGIAVQGGGWRLPCLPCLPPRACTCGCGVWWAAMTPTQDGRAYILHPTSPARPKTQTQTNKQTTAPPPPPPPPVTPSLRPSASRTRATG